MKPDNGIHIETQGERRAEVEGRINGRSPIRVIVEHELEPIWEVVTVAFIPWDKVRDFAALLDEVINTVEALQEQMRRLAREGGGE